MTGFGQSSKASYDKKQNLEMFRVAGGLAVVEIGASEIATALPPTNPGMPMLIDSPGYSVVRRESSLKVLVPVSRVSGRHSFRYDGVTAYMEVGPGEDRPLLGVYRVYDVLSGDLSLPFDVRRRGASDIGTGQAISIVDGESSGAGTFDRRAFGALTPHHRCY